MTPTATDIRRAASPAETTADGRPLALINTRESDEHNRLLFDGMREQTYAMLSDIPAVAAVQKLGLAPLDPGRESIVVRAEGPFGVVEREVVIHRLQVGSTRAILFGFMGYYHLWSQASAGRLSLNGTNEFTEILCSVLSSLRPETLFAVNISRLVRSPWQAARLQT